MQRIQESTVRQRVSRREFLISSGISFGCAVGTFSQSAFAQDIAVYGPPRRPIIVSFGPPWSKEVDWQGESSRIVFTTANVASNVKDQWTENFNNHCVGKGAFHLEPLSWTGDVQQVRDKLDRALKDCDRSNSGIALDEIVFAPVNVKVELLDENGRRKSHEQIEAEERRGAADNANARRLHDAARDALKWIRETTAARVNKPMILCYIAGDPDKIVRRGDCGWYRYCERGIETNRKRIELQWDNVSLLQEIIRQGAFAAPEIYVGWDRPPRTINEVFHTYVAKWKDAVGPAILARTVICIGIDKTTRRHDESAQHYRERIRAYHELIKEEIRVCAQENLGIAGMAFYKPNGTDRETLEHVNRLVTLYYRLDE